VCARTLGVAQRWQPDAIAAKVVVVVIVAAVANVIDAVPVHSRQAHMVGRRLKGARQERIAHALQIDAVALLFQRSAQRRGERCARGQIVDAAAATAATIIA
jgi:hypothetical protein